jgi:outer membrane protein assembly factor BamE (lipoprotein component of BamABCDE complex)
MICVKNFGRGAFVLILSVSFIALSGCQSSRVRDFPKVQVGMEKDQVIEAAGSPHVSRRVKGKDQWTYIYRDAPGGVTAYRQVEFENGRVVYAGEKRQAPVTAEQQDKINEESNATEAAKDEVDTARRDEELGIARPQHLLKPSKTAAKKPKLDNYDRMIRNDLYGTTDSIEQEKQKRAPVFEPVN